MFKIKYKEIEWNQARINQSVVSEHDDKTMVNESVINMNGLIKSSEVNIIPNVSVFQHIETETNLPPLRRRYFQMHFLEWKCTNFAYNLTKVCSQGSNWQHSSTVSEIGLAPGRRQALI